MIESIKKYIRIIFALILGILFIYSYNLYKTNINLKQELSISKSNEKAFIAENDNLKNQNLAFQFTVDQLEYFNDSLTTKMNEVRKELKIKDKDIKQMQYLLSEAQKRDTIVFKDTIFVDKNLKVDTIVGDSTWYNIKLGLRYPNTIITEPTFKSEKFILFKQKKETVNPPSKCFLVRWFQKKHTIVKVEVVEKNPYIENKKQKFIEIIK